VGLIAKNQALNLDSIWKWASNKEHFFNFQIRRQAVFCMNGKNENMGFQHKDAGVQV
jgi:hypothetical protein